MPVSCNVEDSGPRSAAGLPASIADDGCRRGIEVAEIGEEPHGASYRHFEFPGNLASVAESREQVMKFVAPSCPNETDRIDILVALQEALANASLHGCGDDAAQRIKCSVSTRAPDISITICDFGPGFNLALADAENYAASTLLHGRGIRLIRSLMTEVSFARGGTELRMRKHISACSP